MTKKILLLTSLVALTACTQTVATPSSSPNSTSTNNPTQSAKPSASAGCFYQEVQCIKAPCEPVLVCPTPTETAAPTKTAAPTSTNKPSASAKSEVKSETTVNSNTNINITSNGTNVKITSSNGKSYAELDGQKVELDANGCYDYNKDGKKIHACINN